jgi:metal-responsive CopG/Arc/MetJ family transcriptional regulator
VAAKEIAISLPPETLGQIDSAAGESGESRSAFIARICMLAARARSDREIRRKIEQVLADPELRREQLETSEGLLRAGHASGTEWDERE